MQRLRHLTNDGPAISGCAAAQLGGLPSLSGSTSTIRWLLGLFWQTGRLKGSISQPRVIPAHHFEIPQIITSAALLRISTSSKRMTSLKEKQGKFRPCAYTMRNLCKIVRILYVNSFIPGEYRGVMFDEP